MPAVSKAEAILSVGQTLVQTRGYNGFSFRDIASQVGIKSASIHYHFPTKGDLVAALTRRYRQSFDHELAQIDDIDGPRARLAAYVALFETTLGANRLCLCGMLASEAELLPESVQSEVDVFFTRQYEWLEATLTQAVASGELVLTDVPAHARLLLAALEGGMVLARSQGQSAGLATLVAPLL